MESENAVDAVFLEYARLADEAGASCGFFSGLEHEQDASRQFVEGVGDVAGERERHGHVPVVPAGVHAAFVLRGEFDI